MPIAITGNAESGPWTEKWAVRDATALTAHDFTATEAHTIDGIDVVGRYGTTRALTFELNQTDGLKFALGTNAGEWGWWYSNGYTSAPDQEAPRLDFLIADVIDGYDSEKDIICLQWRISDMTINQTYHNAGGFIWGDAASAHNNVVRACHYYNGSSLQSRISRSGNGYVANSSAFEMWEMIVFPTGDVLSRAGAWPGDWEDPLTWTSSWEGRDIGKQDWDSENTVRFVSSTARFGLFSSKWSAGTGTAVNYAGWRVLKVGS